jgi:hypothetical protein
VQEVPGSNPGSPTKFLKDLQPGRHQELSLESNWSPFAWTPICISPRLIGGTEYPLRFTGPLYSRRTRQTRHFVPKPLILLIESMSSRSIFPTSNPTFGFENPTF